MLRRSQLRRRKHRFRSAVPFPQAAIVIALNVIVVVVIDDAAHPPTSHIGHLTPNRGYWVKVGEVGPKGPRRRGREGRFHLPHPTATRPEDFGWWTLGRRVQAGIPLLNVGRLFGRSISIGGSTPTTSQFQVVGNLEPHLRLVDPGGRGRRVKRLPMAAPVARGRSRSFQSRYPRSRLWIGGTRSLDFARSTANAHLGIVEALLAPLLPRQLLRHSLILDSLLGRLLSSTAPPLHGDGLELLALSAATRPGGSARPRPCRRRRTAPRSSGSIGAAMSMSAPPTLRTPPDAGPEHQPSQGQANDEDDCHVRSRQGHGLPRLGKLSVDPIRSALAENDPLGRGRADGRGRTDRRTEAGPVRWGCRRCRTNRRAAARCLRRRGRWQLGRRVRWRQRRSRGRRDGRCRRRIVRGRSRPRSALDVARAGTGVDQVVDILVAVSHLGPLQTTAEAAVHVARHAVGAAPLFVVDAAIVEAVGIDGRWIGGC